MPDPREPTTSVALLVAQAHWLAERYEANSEGFLTRAGIFLGLLGVEAAVIAPAGAMMWAKVTALVLLAVPGVLLMAVFRRVVTEYPSHEELVTAVFGTNHPTWLVLEQTLKLFDPAESLTAQLKAEADRRGYWWVRGSYALIGVQPLVLTVLVRGAWT
ncbi:MAG: hypothetical protein U0R65_02060 [Candidatus Nanopelagicales bacterium]